MVPLATPSRDALRPLWVADGSTWPRPAAKTSPERTWGRRVTPGQPQDGVVPAGAYQWLVALPEWTGSWVRPLALARRSPTAGTPTALLLEQLARVLAAPAFPDEAAARATHHWPVLALERSDDSVELVRARLAGRPVPDALMRRAAHRVLRRAPGPYAGRGAPRKHGPHVRCTDPATHGTPDHALAFPDPEGTRGTLTRRVWRHLHREDSGDAPLTIVCMQMERRPRRDTPPAPRWLAWTGAALPDDLTLFWHWYGRRFPVEQGCRFAKQDLGGTTVRLRDPAAADRWTWRLALVFWHLWLARARVLDQRLPGERPLPPPPAGPQRAPGRVRRACAGLVARVSTPARPATPRGNSPGRRPGQRPDPHPRDAVHRRHPKPANPRQRTRQKARRRTAATA